VASQLAVILVDERTGERTVLWRRDPRIAVAPDEISRELVTSARALHLDGHNIEAEIAAAAGARGGGGPWTSDGDKAHGGSRPVPLCRRRRAARAPRGARTLRGPLRRASWLRGPREGHDWSRRRVP